MIPIGIRDYIDVHVGTTVSGEWNISMANHTVGETKQTIYFINK